MIKLSRAAVRWPAMLIILLQHQHDHTHTRILVIHVHALNIAMCKFCVVCEFVTKPRVLHFSA